MLREFIKDFYLNKHFSEDFINEFDTNVNKNIKFGERNTTVVKLFRFAYQYGREDVVEHFIKMGANISSTDLNNSNPLHYAVKNMDSEKIIELIIGAAPDDDFKLKLLSAKNDAGFTALTLSIEKNQLQNTETLIKYYKQFYLPLEKMDVIYFTAAHENDQMIDLFFTEFGKHDDIIKTLIHFAEENDNIHLLEKLVTNEAKKYIEKVDENKYTPLFIAVKLDNVERVKYLLQRNASSSHIAKGGETILSIMAKYDSKKVFQYFANCFSYFEGTDIFTTICKLVSQPDSHFNTPLHEIAAKGNIEMFEAVIQYCNDETLKSCNNKSQTALHLAAKNGHIEIFKRLLKMSPSSLYLKDFRRNSPISYACKNNDVDMINVILENIDFNLEKDKIKVFLKVAVDTKCGLLVQYFYNEPFYDEDNPVFQNYFEKFIRKGFHEGVALIINGSNYKDLIRRQPPNPDGMKNSKSPIQYMIEYMPEMAKLVFDKCVTFKNGESSYMFEIIDDIYYMPGPTLVPREEDDAPVIVATSGNQDAIPLLLTHSENSEEKEKRGKLKDNVKGDENYAEIIAKHPLSLMVEYGLDDLIFHPLTEAYINSKWNRYARLFYYPFFLYFVLMAYLLTFVIRHMELTLDENNSTSTENKILNVTFANYCVENPGRGSAFTVIGVFHLFFTLYTPCKRYYENHSENCFFNILQTFFVVLFNNKINILVGIFYLIAGYPVCIFVKPGGWFYVILIFISWISLLNYTDKNPRLGAYVIMIQNITLSFIRIAVIIAIVLLPFVLIFFIFLEKEHDIYSFCKAFILMLVMMTGELNYKDTLTGQSSKTLFVVFFIFLIVGTMLMMNLLTALIINDVSKILERALSRRRILQIEAIQDIELAMPARLRKFFWRGYCHTKKTSEDSHFFTTAYLRQMFNWFGLSKKTIRENYLNDEEHRGQTETTNI